VPNVLGPITYDISFYPFNNPKQLSMFSVSCISKLRIKEIQTRPGMVVHMSNPSYLGSRDQEDPDWRPALAKKLVRPYVKRKSWVQWLHACDPSYTGGIGKEIMVQGLSQSGDPM
jgi:hypothetical protein